MSANVVTMNTYEVLEFIEKLKSYAVHEYSGPDPVLGKGLKMLKSIARGEVALAVKCGHKQFAGSCSEFDCSGWEVITP